jgi:ATP-dependent RNA circularization protein (DNA/RNA ligase family)
MDNLKIKFFPSIQDLSEENLKKKDQINFYIEEKIDGSQISFKLVDDKIIFFNKKKVMNKESLTYIKVMIKLPIIKNLLDKDLTYHGEYLKSKKANVVEYDRVPKFNFILYDVYSDSENRWFNYEEKKKAADKIGLECVQLLFVQNDISQIPFEKGTELIKQIEEGKITSSLGGIPEGIVVKKEGAKFKMVTTKFKERHAKKQSKLNQTFEDSLKIFGEQFNVQPRFQKAFQHLNEEETEINLDNLIKELDKDLLKEYEPEINNYIKAECFEHVSRVFNTSSDITKYEGIKDKLIREIMVKSCEHKKNLKLEDNKVHDINNLTIFFDFCEMFKPIICEYARTGLLHWYENNQNI